jgi:transcription antitermination factor NusG
MDTNDQAVLNPHTETAGVDERGTGRAKIPGYLVISTTTDERARWYVVHTASGHEARVSANLKQRVETMGLTGKVFELLIPTQDKVVVRGGKKMLMVGRLKDGKKILENVKNQLYSSKIAKDAEIELRQNLILEEEGFQIKEEINKE